MTPSRGRILLLFEQRCRQIEGYENKSARAEGEQPRGAGEEFVEIPQVGDAEDRRAYDALERNGQSIMDDTPPRRY